MSINAVRIVARWQQYNSMVAYSIEKKRIEGVYMTKSIKRILGRLLDYDIVGEYYDTIGNGHYTKKYIKKYRMKKKPLERWCKQLKKRI